MAISEPNAKRMKLGSEEVCIVLEGASIYSFCLYIVDLNEKQGSSIKLLEPFYRCSMELPRDSAYAMLNSALYKFGGYKRGEWTSGSWTFDLKPYFDKVSSSDSSLGSGTEIPGMTAKEQPCAVVVGGRICVFSLTLRENLNNFELYDPKDGKWSLLPELPCELLGEKVEYYAVEKDDLLIRTGLGSYSITIDEQSNDTHSPRQWNPCELPEVAVNEGCGGFVKRGNLLISPYLDVVDIAKPDGEHYSFWNPQRNEEIMVSLSDRFIPAHEAVVPLLDEHGLRTCVVEVGGQGSDFYGARLLRLLLIRFGERPCEGDIMLLNTRSYQLAHDFYANLVIVKGIYPL